MSDLLKPKRETARGKIEPSVGHEPDAPLSAEQLRRWAGWIVEEQSEFPDDLPVTDRTKLQAEVRSTLRHRTLTFIARAIAHDLYRRQDDGRKVRHD